MRPRATRAGEAHSSARWLEQLGYAFHRFSKGSHTIWRHGSTGAVLVVSTNALIGRDRRGYKNLQSEARRGSVNRVAYGQPIPARNDADER